MISGNQSKKYLVIILVILAVIIWINFFYKISRGSEAKKTKTSTIQRNKSNLDHIVDDFNQEFIGDFRDPFARKPLPVKKIESPKNRIVKQRKQVNQRTGNLELLGVIGTSAILQDDLNKMYFVAVNDSILFGIVTTITPDSVVITLKNDKQVLKIKQDFLLQNLDK